MVDSKKNMEQSNSNRVGWIIALFPSMILYSVLILREMYVAFFLLVALYGIVEWAKNKTVKAIILAMIGFIIATFFHGAIFFGAIIFIIIVGITTFTKLIKQLIQNQINLNKIK